MIRLGLEKLNFFPTSASKIDRWFLVIASLLLSFVYVLAFSLGSLWLLCIPFLLFIIYICSDNLPALLYLTVFIFPFSSQVEVQGTGSTLQLPTEIFIFLLILSWSARLLMLPKQEIEGKAETSKINFWLIAFLVVLFFSILQSSYPIVSAKLLANNLWFITACYVFLRYEMRNERDLRTLLWIFLVVVNLIVVYALVNAARTGFSSFLVNRTFKPFFQEHGSYAAYLAMILGISVGLSFGSGKRRGLQIFSIGTSILILLGIFFSYTRATWLGVAVLFLFFVMMKLKELLNIKAFLVLSIVVIALVVAVVDLGVVQKMERTAVSVTDLEENYSNLERINRWAAALNMIKAHPIVGVGYGTYPLEYQSYRNPGLATPISYIHAGPHNDYLQYFSEAGILALFFWLLFLFYFYKTGLRSYFSIKDDFSRNVLLGCMGGVLTYNVHALFNDFLMYDKAAVPFWTLVGISVVIMEKSRADREKGQNKIKSR